MGRRIVLTAFVFLLLFSTYSFGADVITLKFANYFPPLHRNSPVMAKYCEELNKRLAGKVKLNYYTGGTLLTAPKIAAGVSSGIADIGLSNCAYSRGRFPVTEIMELPLGFPSAWIGSHVSIDFYNKFKPKEWDNYQVLMLTTCGPNILQTRTKPVKTLEDLQGLKIRGPGRIGDTVKALGGVPMPIEMADLYDALRRGVVDGNMGPIEQSKGWRVGEVQKYITASWMVGNDFAFYVVMNKNVWKRLPADVQKVFTDFSQEFNETWAREWNNIDLEGKDFFIKQGGKILSLSDAEAQRWVKKVEPVISDFKKDLTSKGYKAAEIEEWLSYIKERIEYWKTQEKARKIPTVYEY